MALLAHELQLADVGAPGVSVPPHIPSDAVVGDGVFRVPYDKDGERTPKDTAEIETTLWDLRRVSRPVRQRRRAHAEGHGGNRDHSVGSAAGFASRTTKTASARRRTRRKSRPLCGICGGA